jgi:hypothetical protein
VKKSKNNTNEEKKPRVVCLEEYHNYRYHKKDFITNTMLDRLGQELIEWAYATDSEKGIKIKQFLALKGIHDKTWNDWCTKYPSLREAHDYAKMILGNRREEGAITKKWDVGVFNFMQPMYDEDHMKMLKDREDLKKSADELEGSAKIVIMERFASVEEVPVKKED